MTHPPALPPHSPPYLPPGLIEEIPRRRDEILGIGADNEIDYCLVRGRNQKRRRCSVTCTFIILILGLLFFAGGYIFFSWNLAHQQYEEKVSSSVRFMKKGTVKLLLVGKETEAIAPDSMKFTEEEWIQYNLTLVSQEVTPYYGEGNLKAANESFKIVIGEETIYRSEKNDCSNKRAICLKITRNMYFTKRQMEPIIVFYSLRVGEETIEFKKTFVVEIDADRRTAAIMENVLRKVFEGGKQKKGSSG